MELIDKDKVAAEIEKIMSQQQEVCKNDVANGEDPKIENISVIYHLQQLLKIIDTFKVKDVDLENLFQALPEKIADEKSHQVYELSIYHYDGQCVVDYVGEIDHDSLYAFGGNTLYEAIEKAWNWLRKNSTGG